MTRVGSSPADAGDRDLAGLGAEVLDLDHVLVQPGPPVAAGPADRDGLPCRAGQRGQPRQLGSAALAQGEPADAAAGQLLQDLVGGQLGVEHQQPRVGAGGLLPVAGEREDLGGLLGLGQVGVGVDHLGGGVVLGEEGQHRAGPLGTPGHVVLFQLGVFAVVADGAEVAVEPVLPGRQPQPPQPADHPGQQPHVGLAAHPPGVAAQVGGLRQGGQAQGERQPGVVGE